MNDILNSFGEWWRERRNSSLYFTYVFFLVLWNWKIIFLLFVEENVPRNISSFELAMSLYPPITGIIPVDFLLYKCYELIFPAVFTFLAIKYLPKVNDWAHEIEVTNYFKRRLVYDGKRSKFEKDRTSFLEKIAEQKEAQKIYKTEIDEKTTEKEKWQNEFADLSSNEKIPFAKAMSQAIESIYYSRGSFNRGSFGKELLDLLLSYKIISVQIRDGVGERLEFTPKGEEFAKMFTSVSRLG